MKIELQTVVQKIVASAKTLATAASALAELLKTDGALRLAAAMAVIEALPKPSPRKKETHSRRRVGPHRIPRAKSKLPTAAQKLGAIKAEKGLAASIFDRKLRGRGKLFDVRVHELHAMADASADAGIKMIIRGYEDWVDMFLFEGLSQHCVAADPFAKVGETIKSTVAAKIFEEAKVKAAHAVEISSAELKKKLIAMAKNQEPPAELPSP